MSRSGYSDDCDGWQFICWRGAVASAIRGNRGQAFLRELIEALDAMPTKALITGELQDGEGNVCALGAVAVKRGLDVAKMDPGDPGQVGREFGIAEALAAEIMFLNDEWAFRDNNWRWRSMRRWAEEHLY